jgi:hypothetical protein
MNFFDHKDLGNHLLQLCPKVVKHPLYILWRVMPLKTPFRLLIPLLQSSPTRNYFTHNYLLHCVTFTQLTIIHVRDYNHLLHSYTGWLLSYQLLSQIITDSTSYNILSNIIERVVVFCTVLFIMNRFSIHSSFWKKLKKAYVITMLSVYPPTNS